MSYENYDRRSDEYYGGGKEISRTDDGKVFRRVGLLTMIIAGIVILNLVVLEMNRSRVNFSADLVEATRNKEKFVRQHIRAAERNDFVEMRRVWDSVRYYEIKIEVIKWEMNRLKN